MAGDNDPLKNQENGQINSNGNGHLAEALDDTESDNENSGDENERSGYELLPQNDIPNQGDDSEDDSPQTLDEILRQIPPSHTSPQVQDMIEESQRNRDRELIQERDSLFSQSQAAQTSTQTSNSTLDMSKDQAETIRSAMAGFQLPESAIPSWASQLSDEELQKMLQDKLQTGPVFSTRKK